MSIADWGRGGIAGGLTPITVLDLSPYPCDCNALQFRRTIVLRLGAQRSSPFAQSTARRYYRVISEDRAAPLPGKMNMQRSTPTAICAFRVLADPTAELRALDEMERLALTQVAAARQRKREIMLRHGIPMARKTGAKILVMPRVTSTDV
jgi:hypothetical protein